LQPGSPSANDFRFAILGDRTGTANTEAYAEVWKEMDRGRPDFVINVGDSIQGGQDASAESEWHELGRLWARYGRYPLYLTPGNHDIWSEASRRIFEKVAGRPPFYSFNFGNAHFTVLDNSRTLELGEDQLDFLERDLAANRARAPKFVFFHKPYWIVFLKLGSGEFPLHRIARKYGVDYIVSGHGHQFLSLSRDGITYLEVGSSGASMARGLSRGEGFDEGWFYQYVRARVKGSRAELTVKELDPPFGEGRTAAVSAPPVSAAPPSARSRQPAGSRR
jgi:3',5'-cyclic AMP phosphodiesterase CpdA